MNISNQSVFSQFTQDLKTATGGVPGININQVLIGQVEFVVGDDFYTDVATNGFYFTIGIPAGRGSFFDFYGEFEVECFLFYPIIADQSFSWQSVNDMVGALIAGWSHWTQPGTSGAPDYQGGAEWVKGANRAPVKFKFERPKIRYHQKKYSKFLDEQAFIASTKFTFLMPFITEQARNPVEQPSVS